MSTDIIVGSLLSARIIVISAFIVIMRVVCVNRAVHFTRTGVAVLSQPSEVRCPERRGAVVRARV